ncbi:cell wall-associated NlpC family hydrolase [Nakamurella sp. UYEF19]|uniref:excalibur calcium-binding domain-containing protein n=1 Tax=Nakamurella sp. UYEF19 TaxID=1756392 RepID=UPI003391DA06
MSLVGGVAAVLVAALLVLSAGPAGAVPAPPLNPSDQDISDSQSAASNTADQAGRLAALVTTTEGDMTRLRNDLELKGEMVKKALIDVQVARADADAAEADAVESARIADQAGTAIVDAKARAAAFAAASFRQGSVLGSVTALMDSASVQDLLSRDQMLHYISGRQLAVIEHLQVSRNEKVNLDSDARAAQDQAVAARERAQQIEVDAENAQQSASAAFTAGQTQLVSMQAQLDQRNAQYGQALAKVAELQGQRQQYDDWLAAKKAEEERLRKEAEARAEAAAAAAAQAAAERAAVAQAAAAQAAEDHAAQLAAQAKAQADRIAAAKAQAAKAAAARAAADRTAATQRAAARAAAENAAADRVAAQKAADQRAADARAAGTRAAAQRAAAAKAAADQAATRRAAADRAASLKAAKEAQDRLARQKAEAKKYYASCADAEKAGVIPLRRGTPGYRIGLDRNGNGIACEVLPDSAALYGGSTPAPVVKPVAKPAPVVKPVTVYYASCAEAELAGVIPIRKGSPGYRIGLDTNRNGIACEILNKPVGNTGSTGSTGGSGVPASRDNPGGSSPGAWSADKGQRAVQAAIRWVGTPYSWGGGNSSGPTTGICGPNGAENDCNIVGFDCSGLTSYGWAQVGVDIPSYSVYQYTLGQHVSQSDLMPGDLLFYANDTSDPSTIHHVTMYMGNGQMVEAPYSGAYVQIVSAKFSGGYIGATRPGT